MASSSLRELVRGYVAFTPSGVQSLTPIKSPTMASRLGEQHPAHVLSIGMESLGVYRDPNDQARLMDALLQPLAGHYRVVVDETHAARGFTMQGEVRELCGLDLIGITRSQRDLRRLKDCLPNRLSRQGYDTVGYHGNPARFYYRRVIYPGLGFGRTGFIEQMEGLPRCRPDLFNGVCDAAVFARALADFAQPGPLFVHVMTLDAHAPVPSAAGDLCAAQSRTVRSACAYDQIQRRSLATLGQALLRAPHPPDRVVIYGDHMPVLAGPARAALRPGVIPYLELKRLEPEK